MPDVLLIDDDPSIHELLEFRLGKRGFRVVCYASADEALAHLSKEDFDVVLTDLRMRGMNGLELCERIASNRPDIPVVLITAHGSLDAAVSALRVGAYDFITKPVDVDLLGRTLDRAVAHRKLKDEVRKLRRALSGSQRFGEVFGTSAPMKVVLELLPRVAELDTTVLLLGESGTGKDVVARALHEHGPRKKEPFVAVDCASVPETLIESELFGHAKGAFTDARIERTGLFLQANGGTLFLDEIGELPLSLQPKLLRTLQQRTVRPVGSDKEVPCDVRIIAATNRDLEGAVTGGQFREDLYYRINVIRIELPPLRSRGGDILLHAQRFIEDYAAQLNKKVMGLSTEAAEKLMAYAWPGNIRELQNAMERGVALTHYERIAVDDLPERIRNYRRSHVLVASEDPAELVSLDEVERRYILRVVEATAGNKVRAAKILGLDRRTLYRKLDQYGEVTAPVRMPTAGRRLR